MIIRPSELLLVLKIQQFFMFLAEIPKSYRTPIKSMANLIKGVFNKGGYLIVRLLNTRDIQYTASQWVRHWY